MTEKDFWTKYFRAEYLHSTKNAVAAAAEAAEDEELAVFLKDDEILEKESRKKVYIILFIFYRDPLASFQFPFKLYENIFPLRLCMFAGSTGWSNFRHGSRSRRWLHSSSCMVNETIPLAPLGGSLTLLKWLFCVNVFIFNFSLMLCLYIAMDFSGRNNWQLCKFRFFWSLGKGFEPSIV